VSRAGLVLLIKAIVVIAFIVVGAIVRTLAGPSRRRGQIVMVGTVGGLALGVLSAYLLSFVVETDLSGLFGPIGMTLGSIAAVIVAQRIPRSSA
jgi:Co/Zn/Cd efflux system component